MESITSNKENRSGGQKARNCPYLQVTENLRESTNLNFFLQDFCQGMDIKFQNNQLDLRTAANWKIKFGKSYSEAQT